MSNLISLPKQYSSLEWNLPALTSDGNLTKRVFNGVENLLYLYSEFSNRMAYDKKIDPNHFNVQEIYLIGSCARENKKYSDLDILMIAPQTTLKERNSLKELISCVTFCNTPKNESLDIYLVSNKDEVHEPNLNITSKIPFLIKRYNLR